MKKALKEKVQENDVVRDTYEKKSRGVVVKVTKQAIDSIKETSKELGNRLLQPVLIASFAALIAVHANSQEYGKSTENMTNENQNSGVYRIQAAESYEDRSFKTDKLEYQIKAVSQKEGADEIAYLVNGKTDQKWWYQVGVLYTNKAGGGFGFGYELWDNTGKDPIGRRVVDFSKMVNEGDDIVIRLEIKGDKVYGTATDLNGAIAKCEFPAHGTVFVGGDDLGYFTGPMIESFSEKTADSYADLINGMPKQKYIKLGEIRYEEPELFFSLEKDSGISSEENDGRKILAQGVDYGAGTLITKIKGTEPVLIEIPDGSPAEFITSGGVDKDYLEKYESDFHVEVHLKNNIP